MFDSSLQMTVEKFLWIERNLPRYIPDRLYKTLTSELICNDSLQEIVKSAIITDVIYAIVKNANWHTSDLFQTALRMHLDQRFGFYPNRTILEACELLGNSISDHSRDPDDKFLIVYLLAWQDNNVFSERLSGLSFCFADHLKTQSGEETSKALKIALWMKDLKGKNRLWEADEIRVFIELNPNTEVQTPQIHLFARLFEILNKKQSHQKLAEELVKIGVLYLLDPNREEYGLTKEGEWITTRYIIDNCSDLNLDKFSTWCEIWQKGFFQSQHIGLGQIVKDLMTESEFPKIGAIPDYLKAVELCFGAEASRSVIIQGLNNHESPWVKAALLAAGKHLLTETEFPEVVGNLLNSSSDTIQRVTADIIFS